jgi:hypothetical protein
VQFVIVLPRDLIAKVDETRVNVRLRQRFALTRSELFGALIDVVMASGLDLSLAGSATAIAEAARPAFGCE